MNIGTPAAVIYCDRAQGSAAIIKDIHVGEVANEVIAIYFIFYFHPYARLLSMADTDLLNEYTYLWLNKAQYRSSLTKAYSLSAKKTELVLEAIESSQRLIEYLFSVLEDKTVNLISMHVCYSLLTHLYCCDATVRLLITRCCVYGTYQKFFSSQKVHEEDCIKNNSYCFPKNKYSCQD